MIISKPKFLVEMQQLKIHETKKKTLNNAAAEQGDDRNNV